jgi:putative PIN family toxin of toxin-antitoxin system
VRAVVDTVVFVRALLNPKGPSGRALARAREYEIVSSSSLREELLEVLVRPGLSRKLRRHGPEPDLQLIVDLLADATIVDPSTIERVCRDPNDDKLFACAKAASVDYIVSDDNDVLAVGEYGGARTITTLAFLQVLDELPRS